MNLTCVLSFHVLSCFVYTPQRSAVGFPRFCVKSTRVGCGFRDYGCYHTRVLQESLLEYRLVMYSSMVDAAKALLNVLHPLSLFLGGCVSSPVAKFALPSWADLLVLGAGVSL